ncbi:helix-turn-helix domain-containing protein [Arthrobacter bambusae]|uniref:helix-turn-helix domain-containing protein n=1 Tax=Arthrobacter bambusae TaxID=1338426 RepID=UPI00277F5488|nr:helix-turn-helix domain-containing protein [Arthrobacter bambusae]MDQ0211908.1 aconitase B [Arthrobacter bambusae]MDQ0236474.1 aconitase B [Arthrobacter bambusae]
MHSGVLPARHDPGRLRSWLRSQETSGEWPVTVQVKAVRDGAKWMVRHAERSLKLRAGERLKQTGRLRIEAILELMDEGMTPPEIAVVFGVSYQRIQKILAMENDACEKGSGTGPQAQVHQSRHQ